MHQKQEKKSSPRTINIVETKIWKSFSLHEMMIIAKGLEGYARK